MEAAFRQQNPGVTLDGELKSNFQINGEISFRYYVRTEAGFSTLYNWVSVNAVAGPLSHAVESHNLVMEVPILVGGYYCPLQG